jgi:hypothetical protein
MTRWMAAATSAQKRVLSPEQLDGPPLPPPPLQPLGVPPPTGGKFLPIAVVSLATLGGVYYYFNVFLPQLPVVDQGEKIPAQAETTSPEASQTKTTIIQAPLIATKYSGNRVVSIEVPSKMKNKAATSISPIDAHPEKGNRVTMQTTKPLPVDDSSMTKKAISELQSAQTEKSAAALLESHQSAWSAMDATYFSDLDALSSGQLKARVVQLAMEMKDRTKWEAVRLKEILTMKEKEVANQYVSVARVQHSTIGRLRV